MNTTSKESSLEAENARLRARVSELESKNSEKLAGGSVGSSGCSRWEETEDRVRDIPDHALDTVSRLARGIASAHVEFLQSSLDSTNALLTELFARSRSARKADATGGGPGRSTMNAQRELAADVASGIVESIHRSLDAPLRAVDRFCDEYYETGEAARRRSADSHRSPEQASAQRKGSSAANSGDTAQVSPTAT